MMWQRAALCVASWAGITVCAALADETPAPGRLDAQCGAAATYPGADPAAAQSARRVLRLLEILGVQHSGPPNHPAAERLADSDDALPREAPPLETATADVQNNASNALPDAGFLFETAKSPLDPVFPDEFAASTEAEGTSPLNDLRDPARVTIDLASGLRACPEPGKVAEPAFAQTASNEEVIPASSASPPLPIICPEGQTSSRRTVRLAASQTSQTSQTSPSVPTTVPGAIACPEGLTSSRRTVRRTDEIVQTPGSLPAPPPTASPAILEPGPLSRPAVTALSPLPPLRPNGQAVEPSTSIYAAASRDESTPFATESGESSPEPRSLDAVLEPQAVAMIKTQPEHRQDGGDGLDQMAADSAQLTEVAPALERRPSEPPAPEVPRLQLAAKPRAPRAIRGGPAREAELAQLPNVLRTGAASRTANLPQPDALRMPLQSPPELPVTSLPPAEPAAPLRPERTLAGPAEPALLHVGVREQRLMRTAENVVRVVAERDGVCDVLLFTPREIAFVGKQQGTVKVEFWYDGQGLNRASYLVAVNDGNVAKSQPEADHQKIERLVAYLFPQSHVSLVREPNRLIVRGSAVSQSQAVEIISTVRRSQLIPVTDEIVVQPESK